MDSTIIAASLNDKDLRESIDKLVDYVGDKTTLMANKFDKSIELMKNSMKDFAVTQKVSVDLMQEAWKKMATSFDAMLKATSSAASSSGSSSTGGDAKGKSSYPENTIGQLEEMIALEEKRRKSMKLNTDELRAQNAIIEKRKNLYKEQTTSDATKVRNAVKEDLAWAKNLPQNELSQIERKLREIRSIRDSMENTGLFKRSEIRAVNTLIDNLRHKLENMRAKSPKSLLDVLGMDESSLDAISAKMRALKSVQLNPNNAEQVKQLGDEYQRLKRLQAELMGQNIQHTKSNNYLAQSFGYIRNRIVYALTLGAITNFTKQIYEIRGQYELLERSLGVLVNSFERGSQIFRELSQMAIESPFTLMELAGAAKQLTAYNFSANEVVDTTRRLADISAALGVPMERLTYNLGQIRAQTVLTARDARDFANAGLPIVASLADHFTELEGKVVSTGDVYDRMSKKMVSYSDVMAVLNKMTDEGGKFFDFQAKQADTLRVQMANLNLAWNNMLNDIGKSNQGLLTLPVSGLKALFQNWQSIDRVLKSMLVTFGLWKALQVVAIRRQWAWAAATGATAKQMGFLANAAKGLLAPMKALALNPWTWVFVGIQAIVDLAHQFLNARQEMHELNQEIRNNANEASESMLSYLNNNGNKSTFELAKQNKLTTEQGEKAWESIKQQIEQSALSANGLIAELLAIDDVNERVRVGFDYAERIQKAQAALKDLKEDSIKVNQDYTFLGIGEEGLVTDLQDYANEIIKFEGTYEELQDLLFTNKGTNTDIKISFHEFDNELDDTAESINNFIRAYNITDPLQINEILERVRSQIKAKNPEIKGEAAKIFDIELDKKMSELTNGAVDRNASLWNMFMERLKSHYHHAFEDITDEWIKTGKGLSEAQEKELKNAIDANLQYFKDSMPYAYDAVAKMVSDASQLRIKIGVTLGGTNALNDFQKELNRRISESPQVLDFGNFLPTSNDNLLSWSKTQQQAIKKLEEENENYALDDSLWSQEKIKNNNVEIQQHKNLLDLFKQEYKEQKKNKSGGHARKEEDIVSEALKQEISLIKEMQGNYEKLRKAGVSNMDAIDLASKGYEATIIRINQVLSKFGIDKFNAANFAGKDVRSLLQSLEGQRQALLASGKVKTSSLQALDVEIQKLTIDAKTYDMKKVTDGLNNELNKIKDEYELAVELDANPELGNMFTEMFGIDTSELPQTFGEAYKRAVNEAQNQLIKLKEYTNTNFKPEDFDLISANFKPDENGQWNGIDVSSQIIQDLVKAQKTWRDMYQKNLIETEKMLDDYVKKNGEYADRITEIERNKIEKMRKLNNAYFTEQMRQMPEYEAKRKAIEQGAANEKEQVNWDSFQNTRLYIMLFENLEYASSKCLTTMKDKLDNIRGSWKNLKPEQLKQVTTQYAKLESELIKRNPFKQLTKHINDYVKATGKSGKQAQKDFQEAQKNYDLQKSYVAELKVSYEQKKSQADVDKNMLEFLAQQITLEDEKLSRLKIELERAENLVEQYNLMKKALGEQADSIGQLLQTIAQNLQSIATLRDTLQQTFQFEFSAEINGAIDGFARMGSGISNVVNSAKSGDIFGTVNGVVDVFAGIGDGVASLFGDGSARTKRLNKEIEKSVETVRQLNMAYKSLEATVNNAMGAQELQARREQISNKQQQVEEIKRQMELEKRKRSKDRDNDAIKQYQETIQDLELEIAELKKDIVSNLLGGDIKDAAEQFVSAWVEAWRSGGDTMDALKGKFDDMIDSMVAKSIASYLVSKRLQRIFDAVDEATNDVSESGAEITINELNRLKSLIGDKSIAEQINQDLTNLYNALDIAYGADSENDKNLSALQQGIQSITEDTGGAIESYLNIVSQRMFEQGTILSEIRDAIGTFDFDVQLGIFSQMLLQLQQSYQVQQNIEAILSGVLNPSGRAIVVELN